MCHLCDGYKPRREVKAISPWLRHLAGALGHSWSERKKQPAQPRRLSFRDGPILDSKLSQGGQSSVVELKNVLDGSALRSLFAMRLKPNSFVGFTQTLEKKIIPLFRKQKGF